MAVAAIIASSYSVSMILRLRALPRGGANDTVLVESDSSNCLSERRAVDSRRRHSSTGTKTAAPAPRLVTICGPSAMHASRNSLKRGFAS